MDSQNCDAQSRDPRIDPQAGDRVGAYTVVSREEDDFLGRGEPTVRYTWPPTGDQVNYLWLKLWQRDCANLPAIEVACFNAVPAEV